MTERQPESMQAHVRAQFDRQAAHYLHGSAMADQELLERIVRLARPAPGMRVLDVACGAGFLA
jgi:cyclopropane fatty-acyl-phospholipid synthase-like methyltransferase